jgi:GntR family transcriptional regulator
MNVAFNSRDPIYLQVVRYFKEEITTGKLEAGQEIPSRRELANLLKINPNTAQRSYKEMEEQGLITTDGNSPSRITRDERVLSTIREELIQDALETFIASIKNINMPVDELLQVIKEKYVAERSENIGGLKHDSSE